MDNQLTLNVEKRQSMRITVVLILAIGALVFTSGALVLILAGRTAVKNTVELLHDTAEITIEALEKDIETHIRPVESIINRFVRMTADGDVDPRNTDEFLRALKGSLAAAPQVSGAVFWDLNGREHGLFQSPDGAFQVVSSDNSGLAEMQELLSSDLTTYQTRWRPPAHEEGRTYVYVSAALFANDEPLGILAAGVSLAELSQFVKKTGHEFDMTAFILYGEDQVLAHPDFEDGLPTSVDDDTPLVQLSDLDDDVLRQFHSSPPLERALEQGLILREIETDDHVNLVLSRQSWAFGETVWHIGVYAPANTLDGQLVRLLTTVIAAIAVVALSMLAAVFLARYISRPIRKLAAAAESIGRLELSNIDRLSRSRIKELDDQAVAFNRMLESLKWFGTYVPKRLVDRLISGNVDQSLASREEELTVMFTDIIGFTAMSENMAPADVGRLLNHHFETLSNCIEAEGGTLDKYIGDAVMAFWGAPEHQEDHAMRACRAALRMAQALEAPPADDLDLPHVRLKVAIHTGPLLVGNIGAAARMNYTVIGDTVNTCSRIESLCSQFDDGSAAIVLVSNDTLARTGDDAFSTEPAGSFEVKGRREKISVSRLLGSQVSDT